MFNIKNGKVTFESVVHSSSGSIAPFVITGTNNNAFLSAPQNIFLRTASTTGSIFLGETGANTSTYLRGDNLTLLSTNDTTFSTNGSARVTIRGIPTTNYDSEIRFSGAGLITSSGTTTIIPDVGNILLAKPGTLTEFNGPICTVGQLLTQSTTLSLSTLGASYLINNEQPQTITLPSNGLTTGVELRLRTSNANGHVIVYPGPAGTVNYPLKQYEVIKLVTTTANTWVMMSSSRTTFDDIAAGTYTSPSVTIDTFGRVSAITGSSLIQTTPASSFTIPNGTGIYLWNVSGTTSSLSLTLPTNALKIYFNQPVTSLTINGSAGSTVLSGLTPTSATIGDTLSYLYVSPNFHLREML